MSDDRCPTCDRPEATVLPAPEGACGVRAADAAQRTPGPCLPGEMRVKTAVAQRAHDECTAHRQDWRARALEAAETALRVLDAHSCPAHMAEIQGESFAVFVVKELNRGCIRCLETRALAAETVLRRVEWSEAHGLPACPSCGRMRDEGHAPECRLAAALRDAS